MSAFCVKEFLKKLREKKIMVTDSLIQRFALLLQLRAPPVKYR
jgi:hypothetical protein